MGLLVRFGRAGGVARAGRLASRYRLLLARIIVIVGVVCYVVGGCIVDVVGRFARLVGGVGVGRVEVGFGVVRLTRRRDVFWLVVVVLRIAHAEHLKVGDEYRYDVG